MSSETRYSPAPARSSTCDRDGVPELSVQFHHVGILESSASRLNSVSSLPPLPHRADILGQSPPNSSHMVDLSGDLSSSLA